MRAGAIRSTRSTMLWLVTAAMMTMGLFANAAIAAAASTCIQDGDGTFVKDICITAPEDGAVVSGIVNVAGTVDPVNGPRTQKVEF